MKNIIIAPMNLHYFRYSYDFFLQNQQHLGIKSIVLWGSVPHLWVDQYGYEDPEPLFTKTREAGIRVEAYEARPYNYTLFESADSLIGKYSLQYYLRTMDCLAANDITMMGIDLWGALRDRDQETQYKDCVRNLRSLCESAARKGMGIAVGNVPYASSAQVNSLPAVEQLVKDVACSNLYICLETGWMWKCGETLYDWFSAFSDRIRIINLSDLRDDGWGYCLGKGVAPIERQLRLLQQSDYQGIIALKMNQERYERKPFQADLINYRFLCERGFL